MRFVDKYRPKSLSEVLGQELAKKEVVSFLETWKQGKALLLHGSPGSGKTSFVEALAKERNIDLLELNASDVRTEEAITRILGQAIKQKSLFKKGKVILFDEIDGLASIDRSAAAVNKIINESRFPIILTANDAYAKKLQNIRPHCRLVQFKKVNSLTMEKRIREICKLENILLDPVKIKILAKSADGDFRAALTDLESLSEDVDTEIGFREREKNIFEVLKIIFKSRNIENARQAIRDCDKPLEEVMWWVEQNIPLEYEKPEEVAQAMESIAQADLFRSRIIHNQNYRFYVYINDMIAAVSLAKEKPYIKFSPYRPPQRLLVLGSTKGERAETKETCIKLGRELHCSIKKIRNEYLPYVRIMEKRMEKTQNIIST
ncbi:MAG: replication factor C large subunit [Candidatus Aenigmatarchaeota archaeon]